MAILPTGNALACTGGYFTAWPDFHPRRDNPAESGTSPLNR